MSSTEPEIFSCPALAKKLNVPALPIQLSRGDLTTSLMDSSCINEDDSYLQILPLSTKRVTRFKFELLKNNIYKLRYIYIYIIVHLLLELLSDFSGIK